MTRTVGSRPRSEIVPDPVEAWRLGAELDRLGARLLPPRPRGVMRAPHRVFNAMDDQRQRDIAQRLNDPASS